MKTFRELIEKPIRHDKGENGQTIELEFGKTHVALSTFQGALSFNTTDMTFKLEKKDIKDFIKSLETLGKEL